MSVLDIGRKVVIKLDMNGVGGAGANWVEVGQQIGGGLSRKSDKVDGTNKQDSGWPTAIVTRTPWSVSVDGALNINDATWVKLLQIWEAKTDGWFQIDHSAIGGPKKEGKCIIDSIDETFPEPELVKYKLELTGNGALVTSP